MNRVLNVHIRPLNKIEVVFHIELISRHHHP